MASNDQAKYTLKSSWASLSEYVSSKAYNDLKEDIVGVALCRGINLDSDPKNIVLDDGQEKILPSSADKDSIAPDVKPNQTIAVDDLLRLQLLTSNLLLNFESVDPSDPSKTKLSYKDLSEKEIEILGSEHASVLDNKAVLPD